VPTLEALTTLPVDANRQRRRETLASRKASVDKHVKRVPRALPHDSPIRKIEEDLMKLFPTKIDSAQPLADLVREGRTASTANS
jgi:hypothetical protein